MIMARFGDTASGEVLAVLDTRVVDQNVEFRVALGRLRGETLDVCRIALIQGQQLHSGIGRCNAFQLLAAAASDDHLVAQTMKRFSQATTDPRPATVTRIVFWAVCMASAPAAESVRIESYHPCGDPPCAIWVAD
jgi:hypothetical protein